MSDIANKNDCCGCTACLNICPKNAISMLPDEKGFLYPQIDSKVCSQCGLCQKVCPFHEGFHTDENLPQSDVYAVKHQSNDVRMESSSGGMFTAISDYVLNQGGTVYGAAFDENFEVCHQRAQTQQERDQFRGSKYVQSNLKRAFQQVRTDLAADRYVLFSGTPCQTAGLYSFLSKSRVNLAKLYLCDIVCHGAPSPRIFREYINYIQKKYRSRISSMTFRYKPLGWRAQAVSILLNDEHRYSSESAGDIFYQLFLPNIILRDSCYNCKFTTLRRPSDITIGDFWGIENSLPEFEDEKGVSLVLINTEKGRRVFQAVKHTLIIRQSDTQNCMQPNLKQPSAVSPNTRQFWTAYQKHGFLYAVKKYTDAGLKGNIKKFSKKLLKKIGLFEVAKNMLNKH